MQGILSNRYFTPKSFKTLLAPVLVVFCCCENEMKSLIALPVLALITIACGGDGSVRDYEGGSINDNRNVQT